MWQGDPFRCFKDIMRDLSAQSACGRSVRSVFPVPFHDEDLEDARPHCLAMVDLRVRERAAYDRVVTDRRRRRWSCPYEGDAELAGQQGTASLNIDPAGPTCALSAAEIDFASGSCGTQASQ
jgi:hypothetical protein